ncbi:MAG: hypothetical protein M3R21_01905 [Candidatus Dormibacteraeota bacterium]|nr:hypothetical protein [Candidatus Dormibacteraeota bacterium]
MGTYEDSLAAFRAGETGSAEELAQELLSRARERRLERMPIHMQAVAVRMRGDYSQARVLYEESIVLNHQLGEDRMVTVEHLAYVELQDHHADRARDLFASAAEAARASKYEFLASPESGPPGSSNLSPRVFGRSSSRSAHRRGGP